MTMITIILLVLALYLAQLFLQETSRFSFNLRAIIGTRDSLPEAGLVAARLDRAKNNMLETLPIFLALAVLAIVKEVDHGIANTAAMVFLLARTAYIPAYASGIPVLRSCFWLIAVGAQAVMALALF